MASKQYHKQSRREAWPGALSEAIVDTRYLGRKAKQQLESVALGSFSHGFDKGYATGLEQCYRRILRATDKKSKKISARLGGR